MTTPRRPVRRLLASLAALAVVAIVAAPAAARPAPAGVFFTDAQLRSGCIRVGASEPGATIKVTQRRAGTKLASFSVVSTGSSVKRCTLKPILPGDVLNVAEVIGNVTTTHKLTVPTLSVEVDADTETLKITVPTPNVSIGFGVDTSVAGVVSGSTISGGTADGDGDFVWSPALELVGAFGQVYFGTGTEQYSLADASPSLAVVAGSAVVRGTGGYGDAVTVRLVSSTGTLKATARAIVTNGVQPRFAATLKNAAGAKVKAAPGDKISLSTIPGKKFIVRASSLQVDPNSGGGGSLSARCLPGETFVTALDGAWLETGTVPVDGVITRDPISPQPGPLAVGSRVQVGCEDAFGLGQLMTVVVK